MANHIGRRLLLISALPSLAEGEGAKTCTFDLCYRGHAVPSALLEAFKLRATVNSLAAGILLSCRTQPNHLHSTHAAEPVQYSSMPIPSLCACSYVLSGMYIVHKVYE
jgi:hypothetical protein